MTELQEISKSFSFKAILANIKSTNHVKTLVSLGFGIVLIGWLLSQLEWSATLDILRQVPISLLLLGFLCYAGSFLLRAYRFNLLLPAESSIPINIMFPIVLVHYTALNIIPARLGEVSYVYLLKKVDNIPTGYSVSSLIIARIFDQIAISGLFLFSAVWIHFPSPWMKTLSLTVGGFLLAILAVFMLILIYKELCVNWLKKLITTFKWNNSKVGQQIIQVAEEIVVAFKRIQIKKNVSQVFGLSVLIWLGIFSVNYLLLKAFDVPLSYIEIILASTFIILLTVLPFQLMNGIGIHETTWTFIALNLGVPKNVAIVSAFGTHILSTVFLLIFAAYGVWRISHILQNRDTVPDEVREQ